MIGDETREFDTQIVSDIAEIKATLKAHVPVLTKLVDRHDVALYGHGMEDGVITTQSKHKSYFLAGFWAVGVLIITGVGTLAVTIFGK